MHRDAVRYHGMKEMNQDDLEQSEYMMNEG